MNWYIECWKKCTVFSGRARRQEYWMFVLFNFLAYILAITLMALGGLIGVLLGIAYFIAAVLPLIAVGVRRLHDTGKSGWWLLIQMVPMVGPIWLLVLMTMDSTPGSNQYGANPKAGQDVPKCIAGEEEKR